MVFMILLLQLASSAFTPFRVSKAPLGASVAHANKQLAAARMQEQPPIPEKDADSSGQSVVPEKEPDSYPGQSIVRAVFDALFNVQKVFFDGLTAALVVGLLLNLLGFGYTFGGEEGLVVRPLSEMRQDVADARFTQAAERVMGDASTPADQSSALLRLRGGAVAATATRTNGVVAAVRRRWHATVTWVRAHLEETIHAAICALCIHDATESVWHDQWRTIRLHPEIVAKQGDAILKRRRRAAQVADLLGAGYTPRIVFLAGLMLRSLQMATGVVRAFDPSLGYAAGATLAARFAQREWLPCILLGWGVGGLYWSAFRVRPPGVSRDEVAMRFH